jgi:hypothetical protein
MWIICRACILSCTITSKQKKARSTAPCNVNLHIWCIYTFNMHAWTSGNLRRHPSLLIGHRPRLPRRLRLQLIVSSSPWNFSTPDLAEAAVEAFCCFPVVNLCLPLSVSRLRSLPRPPSLLLADAHVSSPNHTSGSCCCPVGPYVIDVCLLPS